jgi:hypothetical protein
VPNDGITLTPVTTGTLWLTTGEADTYFSTRLGASTYWTAGTDKTAALTTAQNDLVNCGLFVWPEDENGDVDPTTAMQNAVCEQALFRLRDVAGVDARADLQGQGVTRASIVGEDYRGAGGIVICAQAQALLVGLRDSSAGYGSFDVTR